MKKHTNPFQLESESESQPEVQEDCEIPMNKFQGDIKSGHISDLITRNENYWKSIKEVKYGKSSELRDRHNKKIMFQEKKALEEYEAVKNDKTILAICTDKNDFMDLNMNQHYKGKLTRLESLLNSNEKRKMLKLCLNIFPSASRITLKYSKQRILVMFEYEIKNKIYQINFREVVKGNHQMKNFIQQEFIFHIYEKLYHPLASQFYELAKWAFLSATSNKQDFGFTDKDLRASILNYRIFYIYLKTTGQIKFLIINHRHDIGEFDSKFIQKHKAEHPEHYKLYVNLKKILIEDEANDQVWNFKGFGEMDSEYEGEELGEQQESNNIEMVDKTREKINQLLHKDLSIYQQKIEALESKKNESDQDEEEDNEDTNILESQFDYLSETKQNLKMYKQLIESLSPKFQKIKKKDSKLKQHQKILRSLLYAEKQLNSKLPILSYKRTILKAIKNQQLLIIQAEPGSGKSTQLPQILCEYFDIFNGESLPILIAEPLKLAVRSLAERVASEMGEKLHNFVDYQASTNSRKVNPKAKIIFKLDRLLIEQLQNDPLLSKYSCLIIDEAHERTLDIDIILGKLHQILLWRKDFRIIITSASMDIPLLQNYFKSTAIKIPGRLYQVKQVFMELPLIQQTKDKVYDVFASKLLNKETEQLKQTYKGHILVFCSGIQEIMEILKHLRTKLHPYLYKILPLHSRLTVKEQQQAFKQSTKTKVILASSLGETSITINGIKTVIDTGYDRQLVYDHQNKIYTVIEKRISLSSAKQRGGRAGRTSKGFCFRLYSQQEKNSFAPNKTPEISNIALDGLILRLKTLRFNNISEFPFLTNPGVDNLERSLDNMKIIGCIGDESVLTGIGEILSQIPIQPVLGRAIVEAIFYDKAIEKISVQLAQDKKEEDPYLQLNPSIGSRILKILSMMINSSNLFIQKEKQTALDSTLYTSKNKEGDIFICQNIFDEFLQVTKHKDKGMLNKWLEQRALSFKTLTSAYQTYKQLQNIVKKWSIDLADYEEQINSCKKRLSQIKTNEECLLACLSISLLNNLSRYTENPMIGYTVLSQKTIVKMAKNCFLSLDGKYPKWILCYNLQPNQYGQLYCKFAHKIELPLLKIALPQKIFNQFNLDKAEEESILYTSKQMILPTKIFLKMKMAYKERHLRPEYKLLKEFDIIFCEQKNSINMFRLQDELTESSFKGLETFINKIREKLQLNLNFEYLGSVQACIKSGMVIQQLHLGKSRYMIKVYNYSQETRQTIYDEFQQGQDYLMKETSGKMKLEIGDFEIKQAIKRRLYKLQQKDKSMWFQQTLSDERTRIPKYRINLNFFTGLADKNSPKVYLNYHMKGDEYFAQTTNFNYLLLLKAQKNMIKNDVQEILRHVKIKKSKTETGINLFLPSQFCMIDEIYMEELLKYYQKEKYLPNSFEFPWKIMVFRDPENPSSQYPASRWEDKIRLMMDKINVPPDTYSVKLKGFKSKDKTSYVSFNGTIESFESEPIQKFQKAYDREAKLLGVGKLHARSEIVLNVASVRNQVYTALKEEYIDLAKSMKRENPTMIFSVSQPALVRDHYKVFISIRGQQIDKKDFREPALKIRQLFKPTQMIIQPQFYHLFSKQNSFTTQTITQKIEARYNYQVFFIFDRSFGTLYIYCSKRLKRLIQMSLIKEMIKTDLISQQISYEGKSLQVIKKKIDDYRQKIVEENTGEILVFEVNYQSKSIWLTGDLITFEKIKKQILLSSLEGVEQCAICCGLFIDPYRMLNCEHQLCKGCLIEYIKQESFKGNEAIECPLKCGQTINIFDIQHLLTEEQFHRLCDLRIQKFVQKSGQYHGCYSPDCPQIFNQQQQQQKFQCWLCGVEYCLKCKNSHEGVSCKDFFATFEKLGTKQCPQCGEGISRSEGCYHMTCENCGCHFCWLCLQHCKSPSETYKHLVDAHGRISDENREFMEMFERRFRRERIDLNN